MEEGLRQNRSFQTVTKVEGPSTDRKKNWYIISKAIYGNGRLVDFAKVFLNVFLTRLDMSLRGKFMVQTHCPLQRTETTPGSPDKHVH